MGTDGREKEVSETLNWSDQSVLPPSWSTKERSSFNTAPPSGIQALERLERMLPNMPPCST
jgi:hypothetical protein